MKRIFIVLIAVLAITGAAVAATGSQKNSLRGIHAMEVVIEGLQSDLEQAGLHETDIQTDVELKLRLAGIQVVHANDAPYFYVNVIVLPQALAQGTAVFSIHCALEQTAILARDPSIEVISAATWTGGSVGRVGTANLRGIREGIKDVTDEFINDYLSVNPKPKQ